MLRHNLVFLISKYLDGVTNSISGYKSVPGDIKEQRILDLEKENAKLKRSNEILQEAPFFFAVRQTK